LAETGWYATAASGYSVGMPNVLGTNTLVFGPFVVRRSGFGG
jgi:hypothetical protein